MRMHAKWMSHTLTQEIRRIKYFTKYKSTIADKSYKKGPKYPGKKLHIINYPYFAKGFKFFVLQLRLLRISSDIWLLGMTNTILV